MYKYKNKFEDISNDIPTIPTKKFSEWTYSKANPSQIKKKFQLFSCVCRETKLVPQDNVNYDSEEPANADLIQYEPNRSQIPSTSGNFETRASILKSSKSSSSPNNKKCTRFIDNGLYAYDENNDYKNRTAKEDVDYNEINKMPENDSSRCDNKQNKLNDNESYRFTDNYEKQTEKEEVENFPKYIKVTESFGPDSELDSEINEIPRWLYKNSQKAAKFVPKNISNCSAETNKGAIRIINYDKYRENNENYLNNLLDHSSEYCNNRFQFDPYEDYQFAERKNSINKAKNMKTIATSINILPPITGPRNSESSNAHLYVYNVDLAKNKNATNLTENVDRQLEELKLIRDELKSLSRSSCMSFQLGNSLEVDNHEYVDLEENFAKLSSPSDITSYRPCGKCPDINCYVCTIDHEYDKIGKSIRSPILKTRIRKTNNPTKNEDTLENCTLDALLNPTNVTTQKLSVHHTPSPFKSSNSSAFTTIKSIHAFPTNNSEAIGISEPKLCLEEGCPFNITIADDICNELKEKKDQIGHKKCQVVKLVKQHMNKAEQSSPRPSCQSWLRAPCQNVNVYITPAAPAIPSDENKEKSSDTKEVIPPSTTEVTTPSPFTNPINTNMIFGPPRNSECECVDSIYGAHHGPNYARLNGPHYTHHSTLLRTNQIQRKLSSDGNPTRDYPEYDDSQSSESFELNSSPLERGLFDAFSLYSDLELHEHCHYLFYVAFAVFAIWFIFTFVIGFDGNNETLSSFCHKYTKPY